MTRVSMPEFRTPIALFCALVLCVSCGRKTKQDPGDTDGASSRDTMEAGAFDAGCGEESSGGASIARDIPHDIPHDDEFRTAMFDRQFAMAQTEYKAQRLDAAYDAVTRALGFRPESELALNLRRDILALRGDRMGDADGMLEDAAAAYEARLGEQKVRIQRLMDEAATAKAAGDFDAARRSLERALFIAETGKRLSPGGGDSELTSLGSAARLAMDDLNDTVRDARAKKLEQDTNDAIANESKLEERAMFEARAQRATLLSSAIDAFNAEQFDVAVSKAEEVLVDEPDNAVANDIVLNGRRARRRTMSERYLRDLKDSFRRWQVDIERAKVPQSAILRWPSQAFWDNITRLRASQNSAAAGRTLTPEEQAVLSSMRTAVIDLPFENTAFSEVVDYLTASSGLNFVIDARVKSDLESAEVTLQVNRVTVRDALDLIMGQVSAEGEVVYEVVGNVIRFISKANRKRESVLRIHPVADLTLGLVDYIPPQITQIGVDEDSETPLFGGQAEETVQQYGSIEELMELVRASVRPSVWEEDGGTLNAQGKNLVIHAPADVQQDVARFLDDLRSFGGVVITIESKFLAITDAFLRDVGVDIRGLGGANGGPLAVLDDVTSGLDDNASAALDNGGPGVSSGGAALAPSSGLFFNDGSDGDIRARSENIFGSALGSALSALGGGTFAVTFIDDLSVSAIVRATEKSSRVREITTPSLTVYNTQRANLSAVRQISFVQDFDVEVAQTQFIADPVIGVLQDGVVLDVRPTVSNDRQFITLELRPTVVEVQSPIATFQTLLGAAIAVFAAQSPVVIQLPEIEIRQAQSTVRIPDGGTVLLGGLKSIRTQDLKSTTPILGNIPVLGFLFSRQGKSEEVEHLMIVVTATITDMQAEASMLSR